MTNGSVKWITALLSLALAPRGWCQVGEQIVQEAYLKAADVSPGDLFGRSVAASGDTIVVGVPREDGLSVGVGGDPTNKGLSDSGAVYVFVRSGPSWILQAYLKASNPGVLDGFGSSVGIDGDIIVVGAPAEDSSSIGVNGAQGDSGATDSGAAYVFERSGGVWSQSAYLKASNTGTQDRFGEAVAVSGGTIVVGAVNEDSTATGVNGSQVDQAQTDSGAAYVFVRNGSTWSQQAYLKASNTGILDQFGEFVTIDGDTVVICARHEDSYAPGVNGNGGNDSLFGSGAAYVFVRSGSAWSQQAFLKASNPDEYDGFGCAVAISGDVIAVGAAGEDSNAQGVNGVQHEGSGFWPNFNAGAAYVFVRNGVQWSQHAYIKASNSGEKDGFGSSVAISGDTLAVGAPGESSGAVGVDGDQLSESSLYSGAAYLFYRSGATWTQEAYLKPSNTGALDSFGATAAVAGDVVLVGSAWEDGPGPSGSGDQADNSRPDAGAVYVISTSGDKDCNDNGVLDGVDIATGASSDCNQNNTPDECEQDCNGNGVPDNCDIASLRSADCNGNGRPDECDIANGSSTDFDSNGIPDDCIAPFLDTDRTQASVTTGVQVQLSLRAGSASALDIFVILGSASGTVPGLADPVTGIVLPLNFDGYFELLYANSGAGIVAPFFGFLDASGNATATVTVPAATNPSLVGLHLDHAYLTIDLFGTGLMGLASNPVPLELTL